MSRTFPLPQLFAGSKRATSAAVSDCAAHSRQLRSSALLPLLPLETPAPPRHCTAPHPPLAPSQWCRWADSRLGNWGPKFHPREFFESSTNEGEWGHRERTSQKCRRGRRGVTRCVWQTRSSITIMDCRGKNSSPSHLIRPTGSACSFKAVRLHVSCTHLLGRIATRRLQ